MARSDGEVLEEILLRTLMGLEDDLDDLRDDLGRELVDYEGRLDRSASALPSWLEFPAAEIRQQFSFNDDELGAGRLGPRAVALGAARVESVIHAWIGMSGELATVDVEADDGEALRADFEEVQRLLDLTESVVRELAMDADSNLGNWLDDIIAELDEKREQDSVALRELVGSGDLEKGNQAREEIAELWEDQRKNAAELRRSWEGIEQLVFEGVDLTVEGVKELRSLTRRAFEGLKVVHPCLVDEADDDAPSMPEIDDIPDTEVTSLASESSTPGLRIPPAERTTSKIDLPPNVTEPYISQSEESSVAEDDEEPTESGESESDDEEEVSELVTEKMDIVGSPISEAESEQDDDEESEPEESSELDEEPQAEPAGDEAEELDDVLEGEPSEEDESYPTLDENEFDGARDDTDPEGLESEVSEGSGPPIYTGTAIRIVDGWSRVGANEMLLVAGLPSIFLLGLAVLTGLKLAGVQGAVDPYELWPLVYPWGVVVAMAWIVIGVLTRHWRPVFHSTGMRLVSWTETREEEDVVVGAEVLRMGNLRYPWANMSIDVSRWESRPDGTFGWYVSLQPRGAAAIQFVAPERNFSHWDTSQTPIVEAPLDIWQVSPVVLQKVRDACQ